MQVEEKKYFKISEICKLLEVEASVLRFWESEFKKLKPQRTKSGQRLYSQKDFALLKDIKDLLYNKKFTIEGAKRHLSLRNKDVQNSIVEEVRKKLFEIKNILK